MTKQELYDKAKMLPLLPGVYIIRDNKNVISYIGKAKRLRTRVSQYFREGVPHDAKTTRMIMSAFTFDVIVTQTENEALTLECSQIKQYKPKYNIMLKDDKGYSYIKISTGAWPRITAEMQKPEGNADYFGPYMSSFAVKQMVQTVNDSFLLPRCNRVFPRDLGKGRPCLYAHIGRCMAVCTGKIPEKTYAQTVRDAAYLITKGTSELIGILTERMNKASEMLAFEQAALFRDQVAAIERVSSGQTVVTRTDKEQDVIALAKVGSTVCLAILRFREGKLIDKREFVFEDSYDVEIVREEFLPQYYLNEEEFVPKTIALDAKIEDTEILAQVLSEKRGSKIRIYVPERGDNATLVKTAYLNAVERLARETGRTSREEKVLDELALLLGLPFAPNIIESYDISNWGDGTSVCGMVVFENGKPKKQGYRRFKIKSVIGTDDYASMAEVLQRRVANYGNSKDAQFNTKPDLILLDGGKGQVNKVKQVLTNTSFEHVPLFGMVKDKKHRTRGIVDANGGEIALSMHRGVFSFVSSVQNEVHRFALDYQKRKAKGKMLSSTLLSIPAIGPASSKALMFHFKTLKCISDASEQELSAVKGLSSKAAQSVWEYFNADNIE